MASNVSRGAAAKSRTKKWLIARGYQVGNMEEIYWIYNPKDRRMIPRKKDQFGSDLIALCPRRGVMFVQCKSGESTRGGTFPAARREFAKYAFPETGLIRRVIIAWPPRAREPRVMLVSGAQADNFVEVEAPEVNLKTSPERDT